jgi:hypothetical protein
MTRAKRVLVKEPVMPHRWPHAPSMPCGRLLDCKRNRTLLLVHLDDDHCRTCLLEFQQVTGVTQPIGPRALANRLHGLSSERCCRQCTVA